MANAFLAKETLNGSEIDEIMAGGKKFIPEETDAGISRAGNANFCLWLCVV